MIFCGSCGKQIPENSGFCPYCGQPASGPAAAPEPPAPEYEWTPAPEAADTGWAAPAAEKPGLNLKKLLPILIAAAVVVVAGLVLLLTLGRGGGGSSGKKDNIYHRRTAIQAYIDEDDVAWLPTADGKCIKIKDPEGIEDAYLTPDGKRITVLTAEGELYITNKDLSKRETVKKDVYGIGNVADLGILYTTEDGKDYRYSFRDGESIKLGEVQNWITAEDSFSMLYTWDGKLYRLPAKESEPEKLASADRTIYPLYLSTDGKTAIWAEGTDSGDYLIKLLDGKEQTKLGKVNGYYPMLRMSRDGKLGIISSYGGDALLIWKKGREEAVKVKLNPDEFTFYTDDGPLEAAAASKVQQLYIQSESNVYAVTPEGDKERILSDVKGFAVSDGTILWVDEDDVLYSGKLKKGSVTEEKELDEDVYLLLPGVFGKSFYYCRDDGDDETELCGYRTGDKAPVRIDTIDIGYGWVYAFRVSVNGDTVYYAQDIDGQMSGTLMTWTWNGEKKKIADDAYFGYYRWGSNYVSYAFVDSKGFVFLTDVEDGYFDLYFWNGKEKKKLASDVRY